jgi:hypothetical protein
VNIQLTIKLYNLDQGDDNILLIESMPSSVIAYQGRDEDGGLGASWLSIEYTEGNNTIYKFQYSLPDEKYGYAGFLYEFSKPQDLSGYKFIEATIDFGEQAVCDLWIIDNDGGKQKAHLGDGVAYSGDITTNTAGKTQTIRIPLHTNFGSIRLDVIKQIEFSVDTNLSPGYHHFTVEGISFIKR